MKRYNRAIIYPHGPSNGARALAQSLGTICVRATGTYKVREGDLIVNWGSGRLPNWWNPRALAQCLNKPQYVSNASDKVRTFALLSAVRVPVVEFTSSRAVARSWLESPRFGKDLNAVVCRTLTRASEGRGIVLAKTPAEIVSAPLYTRYTPKTAEFRIHTFRKGGVIDVQQKKRSSEFVDEGTNKYIRNHSNGWVFCREGVSAPKEALNAAESAILACGLDFGAVDLGYHPNYGVSVYEINTAPGLEGTTLQSYRDALRNHF